MSKLKTDYVGYVRGEKYLKFELLKKSLLRLLIPDMEEENDHLGKHNRARSCLA